MTSDHILIATVVIDNGTLEDVRAAAVADINAALAQNDHPFRLDAADLRVDPGAADGRRLTLQILATTAALGAAQEAGKQAFRDTSDLFRLGIEQVMERDDVVEGTVHSEGLQTLVNASIRPPARPAQATGRDG